MKIDFVIGSGVDWGGVCWFQVKKVEGKVKKFFALPMDKKLMVKPSNFAFGYVGGSPVDWLSKWWFEGLHIKVSSGQHLPTSCMLAPVTS
jgi:hypothetical protein